MRNQTHVLKFVVLQWIQTFDRLLLFAKSGKRLRLPGDAVEIPSEQFVLVVRALVGRSSLGERPVLQKLIGAAQFRGHRDPGVKIAAAWNFCFHFSVGKRVLQSPVGKSLDGGDFQIAVFQRPDHSPLRRKKRHRKRGGQQNSTDFHQNSPFF